MSGLTFHLVSCLITLDGKTLYGDSASWVEDGVPYTVSVHGYETREEAKAAVIECARREGYRDPDAWRYIR